MSGEMIDQSCNVLWVTGPDGGKDVDPTPRSQYVMPVQLPEPETGEELQWWQQPDYHDPVEGGPFPPGFPGVEGSDAA